ncbi:CoA-binding protein [Echinicola pacifica]|uniref:CoA-binding protein n=1 Tax=Echinicola pacifica TaxID=346377 RepID=A0A918PMR8_9BACT|nr:CoA-binding protein [Echinicola pacifica]GGZ15130.1 CoA-binding protein [Echinicola pacifica]
METKTNKRTVIIGASSNPSRYAYMAAKMLLDYGHDIVPLSIRKGEVAGHEFQLLADKPAVEGVDTITLYVNPTNQTQWEEYLISLAPKRIIFNPGTENQRFMDRLREEGIEPVVACTLVMLRTGQY